MAQEGRGRMKVFVSSTYADLKEHRRAVSDVLARLRQEYRGMEYFGSSSDAPTPASLRELDDCDLFIGIYAHRYGTIPPGSDRSITEQEYDRARQRSLPCLLYLVDSNHPWPPELVDRGGDPRRASFIERIGRDAVLSTFSTPADLAAKVATDVSRHLIQRAPFIARTDVPISSSLPARPVLVGRGPELAQIREVALRERLTLVTGAPGCGKTTLVLRVVHDLIDAVRTEPIPSAQRFHGFVWLSARGSPGISPALVVDAVAAALDYPAIAALPADEGLVELRRVLERDSVLIVVDNVDVEPAEAAELLQLLSTLPGRCRSIVTTRYQLSDHGAVVPLNSLSAADARAFVDHTIARLALGTTIGPLDAGTVELLTSVTGSLPLAIEWVLGQVRRRGVSLRSVMNEIESGKAPVLEQLFGSAWMATAPPARETLVSTLLFRAPARRGALQAASGLATADFDAALQRLLELELVRVEGAAADESLRLAVHPLTSAFIAGQVAATSSSNTALERLALHYIEYARARRETDVAGEESAEIESDLDNILYVLNACFARAMPELAVEMTHAIEEALFVLGRFDERVAYSTRAADACQEMGQLGQRAHFLTLIGGTLPLQGRYAAAEEALMEALRCARDGGDATEMARAQRTLALIAYRRGNSEAALSTLHGVDELAVWAGDRHNHVDILYLRGCIRLAARDIGHATDDLDSMLREAEGIGWARARCYGLKERGEIEFLAGRYEEAEQMLTEAAAGAASYHDTRQLGRIWLALANLKYHTGDDDVAWALVQRAGEVFARLGMTNEAIELTGLTEAWRQVSWRDRQRRRRRPVLRYTDQPIGGD